MYICILLGSIGLGRFRILSPMAQEHEHKAHCNARNRTRMARYVFLQAICPCQDNNASLSKRDCYLHQIPCGNRQLFRLEYGSNIQNSLQDLFFSANSLRLPKKASERSSQNFTTSALPPFSSRNLNSSLYAGINSVQDIIFAPSKTCEYIYL